MGGSGLIILRRSVGVVFSQLNPCADWSTATTSWYFYWSKMILYCRTCIEETEWLQQTLPRVHPDQRVQFPINVSVRVSPPNTEWTINHIYIWTLRQTNIKINNAIFLSVTTQGLRGTNRTVWTGDLLYWKSREAFITGFSKTCFR